MEDENQKKGSEVFKSIWYLNIYIFFNLLLIISFKENVQNFNNIISRTNIWVLL
jgi:hypothetical protein